MPQYNEGHQAKQVEDDAEEVKEKVLYVHTGVHALFQRHFTVD